VFADVGHLEQVRVQAHRSHAGAEGRLVHSWRAGSDNNPVDPRFLMSCRMRSWPGSEHMYL
jgi:hypothetical protein